MYNAKIICDSISETGKRLTTFEITFPRIVLAEFNTHRMLSRNSASSRAIPFKTQLERVKENPFIPEQFPLNCKGMQPQKYITRDSNITEYINLDKRWRQARDSAITHAINLSDNYKVHKQICNRLLEPFMWHTVIATATEWDNFFKLRCDENAQYEIRRIADLMYGEYHHEFVKFANRPKELKAGEWHLPFISDEDYALTKDIVDKSFISGTFEQQSNRQLELLKQISVARCARVSYLTHDGKRDIEKDLELFERLRTSGHWSPFEHVAAPYFKDYDPKNEYNKKGSVNESKYFVRTRYEDLASGNFYGWKQFRKEFQDENCTHLRKEK